VLWGQASSAANNSGVWRDYGGISQHPTQKTFTTWMRPVSSFSVFAVGPSFLQNGDGTCVDLRQWKRDTG